jgi:hypothetical protein
VRKVLRGRLRADGKQRHRKQRGGSASGESKFHRTPPSSELSLMGWTTRQETPPPYETNVKT